MKTSKAPLLKRTLVVLMVTILLLIPASVASANVRVPGGNVPFYARINPDQIYHTDDYAVIIFYRSPACIPPGASLFGIDFSAFNCDQLTTTGFEIWIHEPLTQEEAPLMSELKGLGAVPVWFVSWPALQAKLAENPVSPVLTFGDLEALHPLKGTASFYHETLRPSPTVKKSTIEFNAKGRLEEDGRTFAVHAVGVGDSYKTSIVFK
jgi:hypothetical protein